MWFSDDVQELASFEFAETAYYNELDENMLQFTQMIVWEQDDGAEGVKVAKLLS